MFWGITLESGKRYTQTIERSFNVTMAALGISNISPDPVSLLVEINQAQFVLCTLQHGKLPQQPLQLKFTEGEHVSFFIEGTGEMHLTGYLPPEPQEYEYSSSENEEDQNDEDEVDDDDDDDDYDEEINSELEDLLADQDPSDSYIAKLKRTKKEICSTPDFAFEAASSSGDLSADNVEEASGKQRKIKVKKNSTLKRKTRKSPSKEKRKNSPMKKSKGNENVEKQSSNHIDEKYENLDDKINKDTVKRKRNNTSEIHAEENSDSSFSSADKIQKKKRKGK